MLIGLGGNLPGTGAAFLHALRDFQGQGLLRAASRVWLTPAVGPPQPDYLNAAVVVDLPYHPLRLLASCQRLEEEAGRHRRNELRWGPRVLDVDLLLAPNLVLVHPCLELPHPRLPQRAFVLLPACEVASDWRHPRLGTTLAELLTTVDTRGCVPLNLPGWPS